MDEETGLMASLDFETATDIVLGKFKEEWDRRAEEATAGYVPEVEWPNVRIETPKSETSKDRAWARITTRHTSGSQRSLGEEDCRRFERRGLVSVQVFAPVGQRGLTLAHRLGTVAQDAFEGEQSEGVWFRDAVLREVGPDAHWYQVNVTAEFVYDVVK
jgi:hypothetical protein